MMNAIFPDRNPITYDKQTAPVQRLTYSNTIKADMKTFNSKIGVITNYSTSFIAMLDKFSENKDSSEYKELIERIKLLRRYIGDSIDSAKGIKMKPFPVKWKSRVKIEDNDTEEVKKQKYYHNSLVSSKKPYFMIYIYEKLLDDYKSFKHKYNQRCKITQGCGLDVLMKKTSKTQSEKNFARQYYNYMPVIKNHCIGNELCSIIENNDFEITKVQRHGNYDKVVEILSDETVVKNASRFKKVNDLYKKYNGLIRNLLKLKENGYANDNTDFYSDVFKSDAAVRNTMYLAIRSEAEAICPNSKELATYAVEIAYVLNPNKDKSFAWVICSDGIMQNIISHKSKKIEIPVADENGKEYLGKHYSLKEIVP